MRYHIDHFKWKKYNRLVKEYYISDSYGNIVAGDFYTYNGAKSYLRNVLLKRR